MNAYEYARSIGLTGSDAEIVAGLKAIKRHRRNVYITGGPADTAAVNLLHLLTAKYRVMGMGSAQQWVGPLIDLEASNPTVAMVLSILRPMLQVNDTLVYCADSDAGADMLNAIASIVGQLVKDPARVAADVALLSGGMIGAEFAALTVAEFAAQRQVVAIQARITNAAALSSERMRGDMTAEQLAATWSQAWTEAV